VNQQLCRRLLLDRLPYNQQIITNVLGVCRRAWPRPRAIPSSQASSVMFARWSHCSTSGAGSAVLLSSSTLHPRAHWASCRCAGAPKHVLANRKTKTGTPEYKASALSSPLCAMTTKRSSSWRRRPRAENRSSARSRRLPRSWVWGEGMRWHAQRRRTSLRPSPGPLPRPNGADGHAAVRADPI